MQMIKSRFLPLHKDQTVIDVILTHKLAVVTGPVLLTPDLAGKGPVNLWTLNPT